MEALAMNYYEHHLGDHARDTLHLSIVEDGAYRRLLDLYYIHETPLPADIKKICRLLRAASRQEKMAVEAVLNEFFRLEACGWRHKRCDAEIARYREKSAKAKRSAEKRWGKPRTTSGRNANVMPPHCEGNAHQPPVTRNQTPDKDVEDGKRAELDRLESSLRTATGDALDPTSVGLGILDRPQAWAREGCDLYLDVLPAVRAVAARASLRSVRSWKYFDRAVADAKARRLAPMPQGNVHEKPARQSRDALARHNHLVGISEAVAEARG